MRSESRDPPRARGRQVAAAWALLALPLALMGIAAFFPLAFLAWHLVAATSWEQGFPAGLSSMVSFTLWQAIWSAGITVAGAFPVAWCIARRSFPGRRLLMGLSVLPFALPSIVVAFAFVIVYGNSGYLARALEPLGIEVALLYNRWAIVAAHVFFNLPFCVRALVAAWESIPAAQTRAASGLGFSRLRTFWYVEFPHLARPAVNVGLLTFGYCLGSFGVVLVLGGRPEFSTLEVGIYQLIRYDFDVQGASVLAAIQLVFTLGAAFVYRLIFGAPLRQGTVAAGGNGSVAPTLFRIPTLALYLPFLCLPLLGILVDGVRGLPLAVGHGDGFVEEISSALGNSLAIAVGCGLASALLAFLFVRGTLTLALRRPRLAAVLQELVWILVGVSPTVMAFCWLLILRSDPLEHALAVVTAVHVAGTLPLSIRLLLPHLEKAHREAQRSVAALGLPLWRALWSVELRAVRTPLALAGAAAFAYSFGEVAAASVFGGGNLDTIPVLLFRLMGVYRFGEAATLSLLLALVCAGVSYLAERRQV